MTGPLPDGDMQLDWTGSSVPLGCPAIHNAARHSRNDNRPPMMVMSAYRLVVPVLPPGSSPSAIEGIASAMPSAWSNPLADGLNRATQRE